MIILSILLSLSLQSQAKNLLQYDGVISLKEHKGSTFLSVMQSTIKPALDEKANGGFQVASSEIVKQNISLVDSKVSRKALSAAGGLNQLLSLADHLSENYESITFYQLPEAISSAGYSKGKYDLTTFFSLVSAGGVGVRIDSKNITYNVNYGTGEYESDERTGRSFGEGPDRLALDASDKHYLTILQDYVRTNPENIEHFYRSILEILMNSDVSNYKKITTDGQVVGTDFLAVYIAEQRRHLMSNFKSHPWDEALLEVTLLAAFHAGQENVAIMQNRTLTATTFKQETGCSTNERRTQKASMMDYWQFSSNQDPKHCSRSGINITRKDFRALGALITSTIRAENPELVKRIESKLGLKRDSSNLYASLSQFLINLNTAEQMDEETLSVVEDYVEFLMISFDLAAQITEQNS